MAIPTEHAGTVSVGSEGLVIRQPGIHLAQGQALKAVSATLKFQFEDGVQELVLNMDPLNFHLTQHRGVSRDGSGTFLPADEVYVVMHGVSKCTSS